METVNFRKKVYGVNTYLRAIDTEFKELVQVQAGSPEPANFGIDAFFQAYEDLFFSIPVSGSINSHTYLVQRSQEYIGGSAIDAEKQALIEEINSLRQQLLSLNEGLGDISNVMQ